MSIVEISATNTRKKSQVREGNLPKTKNKWVVLVILPFERLL